MRRTTLLFLVVTIGSLPCFAKTDLGDWQTVQQDVPRGWQIVVVTSMTFPCIFQSATDQELICESLERNSSKEVRVRRERIHEIRVEKRNGANALAFGAAAGLAGAGIGALAAKANSAYIFALAGSAMGARTGSHVHILRGKVVYRRAVPQQPSAGQSAGCDTCETVTSSTPAHSSSR